MYKENSEVIVVAPTIAYAPNDIQTGCLIAITVRHTSNGLNYRVSLTTDRKEEYEEFIFKETTFQVI